MLFSPRASIKFLLSITFVALQEPFRGVPPAVIPKYSREILVQESQEQKGVSAQPAPGLPAPGSRRQAPSR